jgi:hypothetical protein
MVLSLIMSIRQTIYRQTIYHGALSQTNTPPVSQLTTTPPVSQLTTTPPVSQLTTTPPITTHHHPSHHNSPPPLPSQLTTTPPITTHHHPSHHNSPPLPSQLITPPTLQLHLGFSTGTIETHQEQHVGRRALARLSDGRLQERYANGDLGRGGDGPKAFTYVRCISVWCRVYQCMVTGVSVYGVGCISVWCRVYQCMVTGPRKLSRQCPPPPLHHYQASVSPYISPPLVSPPLVSHRVLSYSFSLHFLTRVAV